MASIDSIDVKRGKQYQTWNNRKEELNQDEQEQGPSVVNEMIEKKLPSRLSVQDEQADYAEKKVI